MLYGSHHEISGSDPTLQPLIHRVDSPSSPRFMKGSNASIHKSPHGSHPVINKPQYGNYLHVPGQGPGHTQSSSNTLGIGIYEVYSSSTSCGSTSSEGGLDEVDKAV